MADLTCKQSVICKALHSATNGSNTSAIKMQAFKAGKNYTFDISIADQMFVALLVEKLIWIDSGHKMPKAEDLKGKSFVSGIIPSITQLTIVLSFEM